MFRKVTEQISEHGGTPLAVAQKDKLLGVIHLKDIIRELKSVLKSCVRWVYKLL